MKIFLQIVLGIIGFIIVIFGLQYLSILNYSFFSPKIQNVKREVFENTKSVVEGKRQEFGKYYYEYKKSDKTGKNAICFVVRNNSANIDKSKLSYEIQNFIDVCNK